MMISKLNMSAATAALLLATACANTGGPNDNQQARNGALIGAGAGVLAGLASGDDATERRQRALLGGAIGAAGGAAIGNVLDRQEQELRNSLGNGVGIVNDGSSLTVTLPQDVLFATDSTQVSAASRNNLSALATNLQSYPNSTVNVIGHTDDTGAAAYNQDLSQRRATAVSQVLISNGVSAGRIRAIGQGESQPVATNLTPEGRQQNRRVEVVITPN
ncbi:OmpA family protein [Salipiger sp. IMCC34102]|uniref:OmpA family protein n=1 Tax=Salipiger sp. IMCC34102 TaxID=2510647 RepID=UPI00101D109C|nr:OmpA family protein [Salipiger sp. IMCC34102]RYH03978.1 OmpA family protein [Salipiger sp. IMCC34102]